MRKIQMLKIKPIKHREITPDGTIDIMTVRYEIVDADLEELLFVITETRTRRNLAKLLEQPDVRFNEPVEAEWSDWSGSSWAWSLVDGKAEMFFRRLLETISAAQHIESREYKAFRQHTALEKLQERYEALESLLDEFKKSVEMLNKAKDDKPNGEGAEPSATAVIDGHAMEISFDGDD